MPSGASTGIYEALELRDEDKSRYKGKGTEQIDEVLRFNGGHNFSLFFLSIIQVAPVSLLPVPYCHSNNFSQKSSS